jgi:hypothetical protein
MPITMWFLGPYFLMLATTGLIDGLDSLDRAPN